MKKDLKEESLNRIMHDTWADYEPPSFFKPRIYIPSMEYDSEGPREDFVEHEYYENDELFYAGEEEESPYILANEGNPPLTEEQMDYFGSSYNMIDAEKYEWAPVYEKRVHKDEFFADYYDSHVEAELDYLYHFSQIDEWEEYDAYLHQADDFWDEMSPIDRVISKCREYIRTKSTVLNLSQAFLTKYIVAYPTFWDFSKMTELNISNNDILHLDNLPPNLKSLICDCNYSLKSLDFLPETLEYLSCKNCRLKALDNLPKSLQILDCTNNKITNLDNLPPLLDILHCSNNPISSLNLLPTLSVIKASSCDLYEISLPVTVQRVNVSNNRLICIHITEFVNELNCSNNLIEQLFFPKESNLSFLNCCQNNIKSFDALWKGRQGLPKNLFTLKCCSNLLTKLDLEGSELRELHCCHNRLGNLNLPEDLLQLACNNTLATKIIMPKRLEKVSCVANRLEKIEFSKVITNFTCDTSVFIKDHDYPDSIQSISNLLCMWDECKKCNYHIFEEDLPPPPERKTKYKKSKYKKALKWDSDDIHDPQSELKQLNQCTDLDQESNNKIKSLLEMNFYKRSDQSFKEFVKDIKYIHEEIEKLKQLIIERRTALFKEELQEVALHPSRIEKWIQMGFLPEDMDRIM
jgi:hypothetical protein